MTIRNGSRGSFGLGCVFSVLILALSAVGAEPSTAPIKPPRLQVVVDAGGGISGNRPGAEVFDAGEPLPLQFITENQAAAGQTASFRFTIQANPDFTEPLRLDPALGYDCALGAPNTVSVDGVDKGDAKLCDGDDFSAFEAPWSAGYKEVVATIDLRQAREVRAVHWLAGDANWIFKADLSTSLDGAGFEPIAGAQGVDLHAKWGRQAFPWPKPINARFLRFRFHNDGKPANCVRLPPTIMVYDGIENDKITLPQVGPIVVAGSNMPVTLAVSNATEVILHDTEGLGPGAYLLGLELTIGGRKELRWSHLFIRPTDIVHPERARRFGFNGSIPEPWCAQNMRRCGFGWVRFENAKWRMYMPQRELAAFDGSVAPWNIRFDDIFAQYQRNGLQVLPYVFQPPEWATGAPESVQKNRAGYPPRDPADYGEAIFQLVARYGRARVDPSRLKTADKKSGLGLIDAVELWNEPNLNDPSYGPFVGTMGQYFEVMRAGAEGSRRADPSLPVSACGLAGIDLEIVGQLAEYHYADGKTPLDIADIVNVHFYSGREEPELAGWDPNVDRGGASTGKLTYPEQLEELAAWRDGLKPSAELWMTETGNDVGGPIGRSERHQAAKVPRAVLLALAAGVDRVFIYRETGSTPAMHAGAGLLRDDGSTRPAWLTVATLIRQLQGFNGRALRLPVADPKVWLLLWQDGPRRVVAAWTLGQAAKVGLDLGRGQVCDAFGRTAPITGTSEVALGYFPVYLTLTNPSPALQDVVAKATAQSAERATSRRRLASLPMRLFDFGSGEHVGMLKGYGPPRRFTAVGKACLWNETQGYGFAAPATEEVDYRWISDPLERDSVRLAPGNSFRFKLDAGKHALRVRADSFDHQRPITVIIKAVGSAQEKTISKGATIAEFTVEGGNQPVEISLSADGLLYWLTAIPQEAATGSGTPRQQNSQK